MERVSYVLRIDPASYDEYVRRHQEVYPELLDAFREVGISTYSIFFMDGFLFAYLEVDNYDAAMEQLRRTPANIRWQQYMSDILLVWESGDKLKVIPEVFHFHK